MITAIPGTTSGPVAETGRPLPESHATRDAVPDLPGRRIYLLTGHTGVLFVQDGWRDGEHVRADMTGWFLKELTATGQSGALLTGTLGERVDLALRLVDAVERHAIMPG